ncbi:MAG: hypothetical protein IKE60_26375 [Reyranella sp.]|uniref:hypothetical protein n=1 Tax=Reyranella sp. TaxID=1929291 RepID=UPI0025E97369|nr:hypothetical protein [Reyranella sp.]MBR2818216.1 hypothetical protein [Reyranella sp.]
MTNNPSDGTGLDTTQAGDAIAALVTDDFTISNNTDDHEQPEGNTDVVSQEAHSEDTGSSDETQSEADHAETVEQESEADEDTEDTEESESGLVTVVVDGKSEQLPLSEVAAGYQRGADYTRKTQALAEERKEFESVRNAFVSEAQAVLEKGAYYRSVIPQLEEAIRQLQPHRPDFEELLQNDPTEYVRQRHIWETIDRQQAAAQAESERLQAVEHAEQMKHHQSYLADSANKLRQSIPSWSNEELGRQELNQMKEYARALGYSDQEINLASDHRALLAIYKAMKYDALQKSAKTLKPVKASATLPAGSPQRSIKQSKRADAFKRLARSGSVEDAAEIFAGMDL